MVSLFCYRRTLCLSCLTKCLKRNQMYLSIFVVLRKRDKRDQMMSSESVTDCMRFPSFRAASRKPLAAQITF